MALAEAPACRMSLTRCRARSLQSGRLRFSLYSVDGNLRALVSAAATTSPLQQHDNANPDESLLSFVQRCGVGGIADGPYSTTLYCAAARGRRRFHRWVPSWSIRKRCCLRPRRVSTVPCSTTRSAWWRCSR